MKSPRKTFCEKEGYKVGDIFEVTYEHMFDLGDIVVLSKDDGSSLPKFDLVRGTCRGCGGEKTKKGAYTSLDRVTRIYPPEKVSEVEEESKTVFIICESKRVEISRESARALNLI